MTIPTLRHPDDYVDAVLLDSVAIAADPTFDLCKAIYVGTSGDLNLVMASGDTVLFKNVAAGVTYRFRATGIDSSLTTVTSVNILY